jgi:multimeric flavodoxin WrbA
MLLGQQVLEKLEAEGATGEIVRIADHDVKFGVATDEGDGGAWPGIRQKMLDSDILVIATPIWMGQPASVCKVVLERLDAELSETDDQGRMTTEDKVALVAVVGGGRRPPRGRQVPAGAQRHRLQHRRERWHLLGRRGHAVHRLPGA